VTTHDFQYICRTAYTNLEYIRYFEISWMKTFLLFLYIISWSDYDIKILSVILNFQEKITPCFFFITKKRTSFMSKIKRNKKNRVVAMMTYDDLWNKNICGSAISHVKIFGDVDFSKKKVSTWNLYLSQGFNKKIKIDR
jgi:hypothetical protein